MESAYSIAKRIVEEAKLQFPADIQARKDYYQIFSLKEGSQEDQDIFYSEVLQKWKEIIPILREDGWELILRAKSIKNESVLVEPKFYIKRRDKRLAYIERWATYHQYNFWAHTDDAIKISSVPKIILEKFEEIEKRKGQPMTRSDVENLRKEVGMVSTADNFLAKLFLECGFANIKTTELDLFFLDSYV